MTKNLIASTSLLICTVFMVRIMFFSLIIVSHLNSAQSSKTKSHLATTMKRRLHAADENRPQHLRYSTEIGEERDFNDDGSKQVPSIQALYSFMASAVVNRISGIISVAHDHSFNSFPRYIVLQVFRTWIIYRQTIIASYPTFAQRFRSPWAAR